MKLGEIKAQAMRLVHIDREVNEQNVADLAYDPNYGTQYAAIPAAINRCLGDLELRRILPQGRVLLAGGTVRGGRCRFDTQALADDFFEVASVLKETDACFLRDHPYFIEGGLLTLPQYDPGAEYYLLYHKRLARITDATEGDTELPLPEALAEAVPWFVVSEIQRVDEPGEAAEARNLYEAIVERYVDGLPEHRQGSVQTIYGV